MNNRCQHTYTTQVTCRPTAEHLGSGVIPVVVSQCDMCGAVLQPDDDAMFMEDDEKEVLPAVDKTAALAYVRRLDDEIRKLEAILKMRFA